MRSRPGHQGNAPPQAVLAAGHLKGPRHNHGRGRALRLRDSPGRRSTCGAWTRSRQRARASRLCCAWSARRPCARAPAASRALRCARSRSSGGRAWTYCATCRASSAVRSGRRAGAPAFDPQFAWHVWFACEQWVCMGALVSSGGKLMHSVFVASAPHWDLLCSLI